MSGHGQEYELRISGPAQRQLGRLTEGAAAAIAEFMLSALVEAPHRVGRPLQRELSGLHSARRGVYRIVYEIDDDARTVTILRIDHRAHAYRPR